MVKTKITEEQELHLKKTVGETISYFAAIMTVLKMNHFITGELNIEGYRYELRIDRKKIIKT